MGGGSRFTGIFLSGWRGTVLGRAFSSFCFGRIRGRTAEGVRLVADWGAYGRPGLRNCTTWMSFGCARFG